MASLEEYFRTAIQNEEVTGAILLASDVTGDFHYAKTLGSRTLINGNQKPLELDDLVFLASCTKLITTIAALQCVERGQLDLDADISKILPELANRDVLTGLSESSGEPQFHKAPGPITLTGCIYEVIDPVLPKYYELRGGRSPPAPTVAERLGYPLRFDPGEGWMYGPGLDWAGLAVERVTGKPLDDYVKTHIWAPLGVSASDGTFWPVKLGLQDRMVDYSKDDPNGLGLPAGMGTDVHCGATDAFGGQGMYGTGPAYLKMLESLLRNDGRLVSKELGTRMMQPQLSPAAHKSLQKVMFGPFGSWFKQTGAPEAERDWGFGGILLLGNEETYMGKNTMMWGGGINSTWFVDRETGLCGFAAPTLNTTPNGDKLVQIKEIFRKEVYDMFKAWKASK